MYCSRGLVVGVVLIYMPVQTKAWLYIFKFHSWFQRHEKAFALLYELKASRSQMKSIRRCWNVQWWSGPDLVEWSGAVFFCVFWG